MDPFLYYDCGKKRWIMDNGKTGAFIQRLRKEREMTQKDLARQLHITDRAVSKWERGVSQS